MKFLPVTRWRDLTPTPPKPIVGKPPVIIEAGSCTVTLDNVDAALIGAQLRMQSARAPQPDVAERMLRVAGQLEAATRGDK